MLPITDKQKTINWLVGLVVAVALLAVLTDGIARGAWAWGDIGKGLTVAVISVIILIYLIFLALGYFLLRENRFEGEETATMDG